MAGAVNQPEGADENLGRIKVELKRSREMIEKFEAVMRPPGAAPVITDIQVNDFMNDILDLLSGDFEHHNITVHRDFQEDLPRIRNDPAIIRLVFQNILLNALSAVEPSGTIYIKTRAGENKIHIDIRQEGSTQPKRRMADLADPAVSGRTNGEALGLAYCVESLKQAGGHMTIQNDTITGMFSIAEMSLPLKRFNA